MQAPLPKGCQTLRWNAEPTTPWPPQPTAVRPTNEAAVEAARGHIAAVNVFHW